MWIMFFEKHEDYKRLPSGKISLEGIRDRARIICFILRMEEPQSAELTNFVDTGALSELIAAFSSDGPTKKYVNTKVTTHIYDNCVVESCCGVIGSPKLKKSGPNSTCDSFLSFCHTCNKNLEEDDDIYIYSVIIWDS